jgi:hypothetical protein
MNNTENTVVWEKPVATHIDSFKVYRKNATNPVFALLATIPYSGNSMYVDNANGVKPKVEAHTYAITTVDTCGIESVKSDSNTTMLLSPPVFNMPSSFTLNWTAYKGFTFSAYEVWRTIDNGVTWNKINTVAFAAPTTYTDLNSTSLGARYRIRATAPTSCTVNGTTIFGYSLSNVTDDYTSVNEISLNKWLQVYPNPNHGTFTVELSGAGFTVTGINVYNMLGESVYQSAANKNVSSISIPNVTPGIYHLEVRTDKGVANKKITIE